MESAQHIEKTPKNMMSPPPPKKKKKTKKTLICALQYDNTSIETMCNRPSQYSMGQAMFAHVLLGILQIMVNLSPDPTRPGGSELPTFSYGGEGIPRVLKQYRFSPHRYIFQIRWSNQLNQSERRIYAPLTWITTDPGNGLESARRQAIAWTNFYFIIN